MNGRPRCGRIQAIRPSFALGRVRGGGFVGCSFMILGSVGRSGVQVGILIL